MVEFSAVRRSKAFRSGADLFRVCSLEQECGVHAAGDSGVAGMVEGDTRVAESLCTHGAIRGSQPLIGAGHALAGKFGSSRRVFWGIAVTCEDSRCRESLVVLCSQTCLADQSGCSLSGLEDGSS